MGAFILLCAYILVTVGSTTDKQLLIGDQRIQLPLINVAVSLVGFYILVPFFLFAFHLNILINLKLHVNKLSAWIKSSNDNEGLLRFPYIFNFLIFANQLTVDRLLLNAVIGCVYICLPLTSLLFIQTIYSRYHSLSVTGLHYIVFFLDICLIVLYWPRIIHEDLRDDDKFRIISNIRKFTKSWLAFISAFLLIIATANVMFIFLLMNDKIDIKAYDRFKLFVPRLTIVNNDILLSPVSDNIMQRYLALGKDQDDAIVDFAKGVDLKGRDLRYGDFSASNLARANLNKANLQGAMLWGSKLWLADLGGAQFNRATLISAQLQGAFLGDADLRGAHLLWAELNGADLSSAHMQGVTLEGAALIGASLVGTQLQGVSFRRAALQGADLSGAHLEGADLSYAQLQGANLSGAHLQGAVLEGAGLQFANFDNANLKGLLFKTVETRFNFNWPKAVEYYSKYLPEKTLSNLMVSRSMFIKGMLKSGGNARENQRKLVLLKSDNNQFIAERNLLACEDSYIAAGLLNQRNNNQAIVDYIKHHCPKNIADVENILQKNISEYLK